MEDVYMLKVVVRKLCWMTNTFVPAKVAHACSYVTAMT